MTGQHETGQLESFDELRLHVVNRTDHPVAPHFAVSTAQAMSSPWLVREGPAVVPAEGAADFRIVSPNTVSTASVRNGFEVYAVSTSPAAISASPPYIGSDEHAQIVPQSVERIIPLDESVDLRVRLLDRLNQPIRRRGQVIALAQTVHAQEGSYAGEASINGHAEGASPVMARTDGEGVAHFSVRAVQQQPYQLFFQAWLVGDFPQGYSNIIGLRFSKGAAG